MQNASPIPTTEPAVAANADPAELAKFSNLAHHWWDRTGEFRTLHDINPLRLEWVQSLCALRGKRVVDVGCGGGILAESMARSGADVLGVDLAKKSLRVAQLHALEGGVNNLQYREVAVESLAAEQPAGFDVVTCMEMLEHVPDPASVVQACAALAKPGGWVFVSTINRNAKAFALAIVGAEYLLGLIAKGTHEYAKFIRPSELMSWARAAGLELQQTRGLHHNPVTQRYWLNDDVSVNYMLAFRKPA